MAFTYTLHANHLMFNCLRRVGKWQKLRKKFFKKIDNHIKVKYKDNSVYSEKKRRVV